METWQDVFKIIIMVIVAFAGAPVTQILKRGLSVVFDKPIEDRPAILLTGAVSAVFAFAEVWLSGALDFSSITVDNFPSAFFMVFALATLYYGWLKGSDNVLGASGLLKPPLNSG